MKDRETQLIIIMKRLEKRGQNNEKINNEYKKILKEKFNKKML